MQQLKKTLLTLVALLALTTGAWAQDQYPIVYDFEAAANAGENPANKNGSAANGQKFYGWENEDRKDNPRQDYKGYEYAEGSKQPEVCHVWRRSDRINGNVSGNGGLKCPSNKEMAVDGLTEGLTVTIVYDATNAQDGSKEIVWAIGDGSSESLGEPRAKAIINGAEAVPGQTTIKSGDMIIVNSVTKAANGSGYIVFAVKKDMVIKKIIIDVAPTGTTVPLTWDATTKTATLTNGMPAGNVTVSVEYFPQATAAEGAVTAATGVKATTEDPLVTIDASKLTGATKLMYFVNKSTDPAPDYDTEGWTDVLPTAESFTEAGGYNVYYYPLGTDDADPAKTFSDGDICAAPILVSLAAAPTYDVTLNAEGLSTDEAAAWKVAKGTDTPAAFPLEGVKKSETVTVTYTGSKKIIGVKAEKKVATITITGAGHSTTLKIDGCATWADVVALNPEVLSISPSKAIQSNEHELNKGNNTVHAGDTFYPKATDYKWVAD